MSLTATREALQPFLSARGGDPLELGLGPLDLTAYLKGWPAPTCKFLALPAQLAQIRSCLPFDRIELSIVNR